MNDHKSLVSVIIPCRNEEKFIGQCLDSIIANDYPKEKMEILVIDGMSEDETKKILKEYSQKFPFIKVLENPKKFTPSGLNIGIKETKGEIIIRMDSHAFYEKDYISKCVQYLEEFSADNVGGVLKTLPSENNIVSKAIAICLSHPFGAGGSYFRIGSQEPKWVDTVFGGCYKKETFQKIGFFNENLIRSQDFEFNLRLKKNGGKILLMPDIISYYYPSSDILDFWQHNFHDGIWSVLPLNFIKMPFSLRHYLPLLLVINLLFSLVLSPFFLFFRLLFVLILGIYFLISFYFSFKIAFKEKNFRYFFIMPVVFGTRHFGYGLGSLRGLLKLFEFNSSNFTPEERKQKEIEYYDKQAEILIKNRIDNASKGDFEGFNPLLLSSFKFCYNLLEKNCRNKIVLDYGCGNGVHTSFLAKTGAEKVTAIDLSEKSLEVAKLKIKREGVGGKVEFLKMDCEKMDFFNNSFDVIFDGGTFSSLDLKKALPELLRVLKPEGVLIGIETFGHNPLTNLKRRINQIRGKRTDWATEHIFK